MIATHVFGEAPTDGTSVFDKISIESIAINCILPLLDDIDAINLFCTNSASYKPWICKYKVKKTIPYSTWELITCQKIRSTLLNMQFQSILFDASVFIWDSLPSLIKLPSAHTWHIQNIDHYKYHPPVLSTHPLKVPLCVKRLCLWNLDTITIELSCDHDLDLLAIGKQNTKTLSFISGKFKSIRFIYIDFAYNHRFWDLKTIQNTLKFILDQNKSNPCSISAPPLIRDWITRLHQSHSVDFLPDFFDMIHQHKSIRSIDFIHVLLSLQLFIVNANQGPILNESTSFIPHKDDPIEMWSNTAISQFVQIVNLTQIQYYSFFKSSIIKIWELSLFRHQYYRCDFLLQKIFITFLDVSLMITLCTSLDTENINYVKQTIYLSRICKAYHDYPINDPDKLISKLILIFLNFLHQPKKLDLSISIQCLVWSIRFKPFNTLWFNQIVNASHLVSLMADFGFGSWKLLILTLEMMLEGNGKFTTTNEMIGLMIHYFDPRWDINYKQTYTNLIVKLVNIQVFEWRQRSLQQQHQHSHVLEVQCIYLFCRFLQFMLHEQSIVVFNIFSPAVVIYQPNVSGIPMLNHINEMTVNLHYNFIDMIPQLFVWYNGDYHNPTVCTRDCLKRVNDIPMMITMLKSLIDAHGVPLSASDPRLQLNSLPLRQASNNIKINNKSNQHRKIPKRIRYKRLARMQR